MIAIINKFSTFLFIFAELFLNKTKNENKIIINNNCIPHGLCIAAKSIGHCRNDYNHT